MARPVRPPVMQTANQRTEERHSQTMGALHALVVETRALVIEVRTVRGLLEAVLFEEGGDEPEPEPEEPVPEDAAA
jgi:hypothetical protein